MVCFDVGLLSGVLSKFYVDVKQFYARNVYWLVYIFVEYSEELERSNS